MRHPKDITINGKQLDEILKAHMAWVMNKEGGSHADLSGADLSHADLSDADLRYADLSDADLSDADLSHADLSHAVLRYAVLSGADLSDAVLSYADLSDADLSHAVLRGADLSHADLRDADLRYAVLSGADLSDADLSHADLSHADLRDANNTELAAAITTITPEGDLIGWKKLRDDRIAKLFIPAEAKRSNATGRKCRAEFAKVLGIWDGEKQVEEGISQYDKQLTYRVGDIVRPAAWDDNRWDECSSGIHFFITRIEAEKYR